MLSSGKQNSPPTKILVRLPNWLGDLVMASAFLQELKKAYPQATITIIIKKGLEGLLPFFPSTQRVFVFSKEDYKGLIGLWRFGLSIRMVEKADLFFCLPNSFSSALMGFAAGAKKRIGYRHEARSWLLTHAYPKPKRLHRVQEYIHLLEQYSDKNIHSSAVSLFAQERNEGHVVVNINSEASSRRLTTTMAIELLNALRESIPNKILLIGSSAEEAFVISVWHYLKTQEGIEVRAGKTSLAELASVLASASLVLTTDSGPAHLANALGTYTIVLFGAGNENRTAPFNAGNRTIIRLGKLSCEPCEKNMCIQFGTPQCLELLDVKNIVDAVKNKLT